MTFETQLSLLLPRSMTINPYPAVREFLWRRCVLSASADVDLQELFEQFDRWVSDTSSPRCVRSSFLDFVGGVELELKEAPGYRLGASSVRGLRLVEAEINPPFIGTTPSVFARFRKQLDELKEQYVKASSDLKKPLLCAIADWVLKVDSGSPDPYIARATLTRLCDQIDERNGMGRRNWRHFLDASSIWPGPATARAARLETIIRSYEADKHGGCFYRTKHGATKRDTTKRDATELRTLARLFQRWCERCGYPRIWSLKEVCQGLSKVITPHLASLGPWSEEDRLREFLVASDWLEFVQHPERYGVRYIAKRYQKWCDEQGYPPAGKKRGLWQLLKQELRIPPNERRALFYNDFPPEDPEPPTDYVDTLLSFQQPRPLQMPTAGFAEGVQGPPPAAPWPLTPAPQVYR